MSGSGVAVCEEVVDAFNNLKLQGKFQYVIYKIRDDLKEVVLEYARDKTSGEEPDAILEEFFEKLSSCITEPRYAVYDFSIEKAYGDQKGKKQYPCSHCLVSNSYVTINYVSSLVTSIVFY